MLRGIIFAMLLISPISIAFFANPASAEWVGTSDQAGVLKNVFYDNETVYVASDNITSAAQDVRVYIVQNNDSWVDGKALSDITGTGYRTLTTNSSGHIVVTSVWSSPAIGTYDIVADVDRNAEYNSSHDFLNSSSTVGFTVLEAPTPALHVEEGRNNPSSHDWDLENDIGHNSMLQLNFTATIQAVRINSIALTASGTGDDKEDITVVYLILDSDGDGEWVQGERFLGYSDYFFDDGVITFVIDGGQIVPTTGSVDMLITYVMSSSGQAGSTYKFEVISITAVGEISGETADMTGFPIGSAIKTISGAVATTTTSTSTITTIPTDECQTDEDCGGTRCVDKQKTTYNCRYDSNKGVNVCAGTIVSVICCGDADCIEGYYCLSNRCEKEAGSGVGGWLGGGLSGRNFLWTLGSIVVVIAVAAAVFFVIKNRKGRQWKSRREYEREWETLRGKWGEKKKRKEEK